MSEPLPLAHVEGPRARSLAWILPAGTLLAVALLAFEAWRAPGVDVRVRLAEGHGLAAGAPLRYRGVEVGSVRAVQLASDLSGVDLVVRIAGDGAALAREGTRFWVERARVAGGGVSGLDTLFAGPHLAVEPGPSSGPARRQFRGLPARPLDSEGGLEITLTAPRRGGVAPGAPVSYRQLPVGRVLSVGLSSDAGAVELRLWVEPEYAPLVRQQSRFWEASGLRLRAGLLDGVALELESLESLWSGGVAFATPPDGGPAAVTGQRFSLQPEVDPRWLEWRPAVAVGQGELLPGGAPVRPIRASLWFDSGRLWTSRRSASGWVLAVEGGLLGPADLLLAPEGARAGSARLEFEGRSLPLDRAQSEDQRLGLRLLPLADGPTPVWPAGRVRTIAEPEDVLLWADPAGEPVAISADGWQLAPGQNAPPSWVARDSLGLDSGEWHGALVLARADGALLGLVHTSGKSFAVFGLPPSGAK